MTPTLPPNPDTVTNAQLFLLMRDMQNKLTSVETKLTNLEREQRDMLDTWKAGKTVLRIIKIAGSVGLAIGALVAMFKGASQ